VHTSPKIARRGLNRGTGRNHRPEGRIQRLSGFSAFITGQALLITSKKAYSQEKRP
jgi:hypothetical protein